MWCFVPLLVWLGVGAVAATCDWNKIQGEMKCDLRSLDYNKNLSLDHLTDLVTANKLELTCEDEFFLESNIRSDHFGHLSSLSSLEIRDCKIRTLPPRSFVGLSNLETLTIQSHNSRWNGILLDIDYEAFVGLEKLKSVRLSDNNIFETPARLFCPLSNLETIDLRNNRLVNLEDLGLSNKTGEQCRVPVRELDVSSNKLSSLTPGSLAASYRLERLIASDNELTVLERNTFRGLTSLTSLHLSHNDISALSPDLFLDNSQLEEINLSNNSLATIHLSVFRNLSKLEILNLSGNALDSSWLKEDIFTDLTSLTVLDVSHNKLSSIDKALLQQTRGLRELHLSHNRLTVLSSQALRQLTGLQTLSLSHNRLETLAQLAFSHCPNLQTVLLNNNNLQTLDDQLFSNLTKLRTLSVSRNLLSSLPTSLSHLAGLRHLDVSSNIIGVISPRDIQGLNNLTFLNLSSNDINRIDGATFNETPSLVSLDLSKNRLQGLDQSSFAALANLTRLNLAENSLKDINGLLTMQMRLEHLNISANKLHWFDYAFVPNSLKVLDIHDNQIDSVENYYSLRDGFQLEFLDVSRNRIRALGVLSLLPSLKTIILGNNKISDIGHNTFLNKDNLTFVDLSANQLSVLNIAALAVSETLKNEKPTFLMADNPYHCSCQMQWMVNPGYNERLPIIADLEDAECLVNYYGNSTSVARMTSVPSNQFLCEYESHCFSLCMCCDFFGCDCRMQCPDGCSCFHDSTWSANIIQCSARAHTEVPALIPMDATSVFLDGNNLADLSGQIFLGRSRMKNLYLNNSQVVQVSNNTFLGLLDLQLLDLSDNLLQVLSGLEFSDLANLRELYLQNNKILHIAHTTFRPLKSLSVVRLDNNLLTSFPVWELSANPFLIGMYIANNVWTCECDFVSKFRMFIDGNLDKVMDARETQCIVNTLIDGAYSKSGRNCIESTNAAYRTQTTGDMSTIGIIIGCCLMLLAVIFLVFATYKMQDTLKLWIHAKYGIRIPSKNSCAGNSDKLLDAYFSYCLKDDQVVDQIARELAGYRLCLHHRDLLGQNRNSSDAAQSAATASTRTVIVISKAFLASEWDLIKTFLLGPESGDISRNVIIILLSDMFDYENIQNFEVKTFINSSQHILRWQESKFWAKLRYLLPDPISGSLDKTNMTQLDGTDCWTFSPVKEIPDSGVSSAHISQVSLNQVARSDSMRYKTRSRQSIPSTVGSNNEFIYLTPKPKKAKQHCQGGEEASHQRSSSEVYQQATYQANYHQRSKSTLVPPTASMYPHFYETHGDVNVEEPMIPLNLPQSSGLYNQIEDSTGPVYGSTSFIYKLISSNPHDTPTLPLSPPAYPHSQPPPPYQRPAQPPPLPVQHVRSLSQQHQQHQQHQQYQQYQQLLQQQLSRSSSEVAGRQTHRREVSSPARHRAEQTIHQRSKSSPYNGFVV